MRSPSFRVQVLALILAALGTMYSDTALAQPAPAIVRAVIARLTAPAARGAASVETRAAINRYLAHEAEFTASSVRGGARLSASSESEIKGAMLRSEDVLAVCNKNPSVLREQASARLLQAFGAISKNKGASAHLADEFSQSTLLTILEQCDKFRTGYYKDPAAVSYKMLQNKMRSAARKATRQAEDPLEDVDSIQLSNNPEASYEARKFLDDLPTKLTPRQFDVFKRWVLDKDPNEIAAELNITSGQVRALQSQIRTRAQQLNTAGEISSNGTIRPLFGGPYGQP